MANHIFPHFLHLVLLTCTALVNEFELLEVARRRKTLCGVHGRGESEREKEGKDSRRRQTLFLLHECCQMVPFHAKLVLRFITKRLLKCNKEKDFSIFAKYICVDNF